MLRDAELFRSRLGKLDGAADVGDHIVNIVNSKVVAEKGAAATESKPASATQASSTEATATASEKKPVQDGEKK